MRITKLFPFALAALVMSSCATDNGDDNNGNGGEGSTKYLAVNLVSVGSTGTRANGTDYLENGTDAENKINDIRFYFFNSDGSPYTLANNNGLNWLEPSDDFNGSKNPEGSNVAQISNSVLVIKNEGGEAAPYSIIAVVNPSSLGGTLQNSLGNNSKTLETLKTSIIDNKFFATDATGSQLTNYKKAAQAKNFVMSNSVYDQAGQTMCQANVSGHVSNTTDGAKANPVDIYVERAVAKVTANIDESAGWKKGDGTNWGTNEYGKVVGKTTGGLEVYAVIKGWNVADENGLAQLEKQIDNRWTNTSLGFPTGETWTSADYHRSFWSLCVPVDASNNPPINYTYNQIEGNKLGSVVYTLPNTLQYPADFADVYHNRLTKFIVAAQLRYQDTNSEDKAWKNAEICEYKGIQYLSVEDVLDAIGADSRVYVKTSEGNEDKYTTIGHDDMTMYADQDNTTKDYKAIAAINNPLGSSTARTDLYTKTSDGKFEPISYEAANALVQQETADVRNQGMCYYYTPIRHLGTDPKKAAYYGVVRNHVYKINLQNITGFGTPVVDATKVITPTVPDNEATYLAARINVLSWRIVNQNANLDSGKSNQ